MAPTPAKPAAGAAAVPAPAPKARNPIVQGYLVLYNLASMVGWSYVLFLLAQYLASPAVNLKAVGPAVSAVGDAVTSGNLRAVPAALQGVLTALSQGGLAGVWKAIEMPLKIVQTAAVLEIVHAATGLVRSPLFTTFVQVISRLLVLWAIIDLAPIAQASPFVALTAGSWGLVEPPRYLLYALSEMSIDPPYILKWLRYSLFIVLYPSGITGEVGCLLTALPWVWSARPWAVDLPNRLNLSYSHGLFLTLALLSYIPGSPTMIGHMWASRKKKLAEARAEGAKPKAE